MAESRAVFERRIRVEAQQMRKDSLAEYNRRTKEIAAKWKEDLAAIKAENDRLHNELKEWRMLDVDQIRNYLIENLERGKEWE